MKLGFLTNALVWEGLNNIRDMADWAASHGFETLEVGPNIPLDEALFSEVLEEGKMTISALTYCRNYLSPDAEERSLHRKELISRIQSAGRLGIPVVVTSTGFDSTREREHYDGYEAIRNKPLNSLDPVVRLFAEVLEAAEKANVRVAIENCPLMGNMMISPEMWERLLERLESPYLGMAYDPSHLLWQMIDPYEPIKEFGPKIFHVHAKDTEILRGRLARTGILTDFSWWRYRLPGLGELDWVKFISNLREAGYNGMVSIEHEDPVWGGTISRIQEGLLIAKRYIEQIPGFRVQ
ncbi:sugar phosphate isomerase/epimerase family protein [Paenibacillus sp. NPDC056579]|uniref:sugar phosphate isomerase/epimerase family protein n=1 Tax=Paenibacillus sp. NPDC056579 TaxID=3345871 RepID=UPI003689D253